MVACRYDEVDDESLVKRTRSQGLCTVDLLVVKGRLADTLK